MEGKAEGQRGKGRLRVKWMDSIKDRMNLSNCDCVRLTNKREEWKSMTVKLLVADDT